MDSQGTRGSFSILVFLRIQYQLIGGVLLHGLLPSRFPGKNRTTGKCSTFRLIFSVLEVLPEAIPFQAMASNSQMDIAESA